jgi:hypothetical protein
MRNEALRNVCHDQGSKINDERRGTGGLYVRREKSTGFLVGKHEGKSVLIEA